MIELRQFVLRVMSHHVCGIAPGSIDVLRHCPKYELLYINHVTVQWRESLNLDTLAFDIYPLPLPLTFASSGSSLPLVTLWLRPLL